MVRKKQNHDHAGHTETHAAELGTDTPLSMALGGARTGLLGPDDAHPGRTNGAGDMARDRFEGCLLGLALGDALGAPLEGGPLERLAWRLLGKTKTGEMRWTDDTQMSLDLAESLIAKGHLDEDDVARRFAASYRWSRGYGPGAAKLLKRIARGADWREANRSVYPDGSFGNGGAMRAPVVGLFYGERPGELQDAARRTAGITHAHPLGIEGSLLVASATAVALRSTRRQPIVEHVRSACELEPLKARLAIATGWLAHGEEPSAREVARQLGNGIAAAESCVSAVYLAERFIEDSFETLQNFVASCRGDVDTIGAMAGAVWGAANGAAALPRDRLAKLEQSDRIASVANELWRRS